jgi:inositol hexakisphosphate
MKLPLLLIFPASWATLALTATAALEQLHPPAPALDAATPLLVWDVAPDLRGGLPRNFRTTDDPLKLKGAPKPDTTGLAELHASGSAEFTPAGLKLMTARMHGPVTVFDLRQEDHLFVNGEPISWYATNNWANVGKSHDAILAAEARREAACGIGTKLELNDDKAKKGGDGVTPPEQVTVTAVQTEREITAAAGMGYVRLTVSDHSRPTDDEVDRFIAAVRAMPADGWAHFHCRAGKGRTTTFLALYDMLHNAGRVSLEDIANRQSLLVGDYNLLTKESDAEWKEGVSADRAVFVRAFYEYARANPVGRPQLWTEWVKGWKR